MKKESIIAGAWLGLAAGLLVFASAGCANIGTKHVSADEFITQGQRMEHARKFGVTSYVGHSPWRVYIEDSREPWGTTIYWTELDSLPKDIADTIRSGKSPWTPWQDKMKKENTSEGSRRPASGSLNPTNAPKYNRAVELYQQKDALADAQAAFRGHDWRVYAAMGVGQYYPGLEFKVGKALEERFGALYLPGTSDAIESDAHREYINAATSYAGHYNTELLRLLKSSGKQ